MNTPEKKDVLVIANPVAGSCSMDALKAYLDQAAQKTERRYELYETNGKDNLHEVIEKALQQGIELFVAAGGDGTVSAVASELMGKDKILAIIPAGTANLLAKALQIPLDIETACLLAFEAKKTRAIDSLKTHQKNFFSHISMGAYSRIAERTPSKAKRLFGRLAYTWSGLLIFWKARTWKFDLNLDGNNFTSRASTIMIANVGELGAQGLKWGHEIFPDDGVIDICLIKARTFGDYLLLAWDFFVGNHRKSPLTTYYQATRYIKIIGPPHLPVRGDGEIITEGSIEIEICKNALKIAH
jgi:diacylglycerol kinase (ATP)